MHLFLFYIVHFFLNAVFFFYVVLYALNFKNRLFFAFNFLLPMFDFLQLFQFQQIFDISRFSLQLASFWSSVPRYMHLQPCQLQAPHSCPLFLLYGANIYVQSQHHLQHPLPSRSYFCNRLHQLITLNFAIVWPSQNTDAAPLTREPFKILKICSQRLFHSKLPGIRLALLSVLLWFYEGFDW